MLGKKQASPPSRRTPSATLKNKFVISVPESRVTKRVQNSRLIGKISSLFFRPTPKIPKNASVDIFSVFFSRRRRSPRSIVGVGGKKSSSAPAAAAAATFSLKLRYFEAFRHLFGATRNPYRDQNPKFFPRSRIVQKKYFDISIKIFAQSVFLRPIVSFGCC